MPLSSVLWLIITFESPRKRRIVPELVEPVLTLKLIVLVLTLANTMRSDVPATRSLFVTSRPEEAATTRTEVLVSPLNLLLSIIALQRPKFVWMPFPEPGPGLLLF